MIYEWTDRAARVIRATQAAESGGFKSPLLIPLVGDEIEFPHTGRVVFTVLKRRLRMTEGPHTVTLLLDAPEDAAGPVDSVA